METCANCGNPLGVMEAPRYFRKKRVCPECHVKLWGDAAKIPGVIIGVIIGLGLVVVIAWNVNKPHADPALARDTVTTPAAVKLPVGYDPTQRTARASAITKMEDTGIFADLRVSSDMGIVYAGRTWYAATFDQKERFSDIAFQCCLDMNPKCFVLIVRNQQTNKTVARFSVLSGLEVE